MGRCSSREIEPVVKRVWLTALAICLGSADNYPKDEVWLGVLVTSAVKL